MALNPFNGNLPKSSSKPTNFGRWSAHEHNIFLSHLEAHCRDWKTISLLMKTRTEQQVRSHAQKFYLKLYRRSEKGKVLGKSKLTKEEVHYKKLFDGTDFKEKEVRLSKNEENEEKENIEDFDEISESKAEEVYLPQVKQEMASEMEVEEQEEGGLLEQIKMMERLMEDFAELRRASNAAKEQQSRRPSVESHELEEPAQDEMKVHYSREQPKDKSFIYDNIIIPEARRFIPQKESPEPQRKPLGWQVTTFPGSAKAYREWKLINKKYFEDLENQGQRS